MGCTSRIRSPCQRRRCAGARFIFSELSGPRPATRCLRKENPFMQIGSNTGSSAIARVREGMRVLDVAGSEIGKVEYVQMGDPEAVTTAGNQATPDLGGLVEANTS